MVWMEDGIWLDPGLRRRLVAFARRLVGEGEAEDLAQEAIVRAGTRSTPLRSPERAEAWLFRICRHAAIDHLRSRRVRKGVWAAMPEDVGNWAEPGRDRARRKAAPVPVDTRALVPHQRLLLHLHYRTGLAQPRLCALTGLSPAALRVRLFRARRALVARVERPPGDVVGSLKLVAPGRR